MRGVSPTISSMLLVLVVVAAAAVLYPWVSGLGGLFSSSIRTNVANAARKITARISVFPPSSSKGGIFIAYNSGETTLTDVKVIVWDDTGSQVPVDVNFDFSGAGNGAVAPGGFIFFLLPNNLRGWKVLVSANETSVVYEFW